jgi:serine/threonine-protein kinase
VADVVTAPPIALTAALADRYRVDRELGAGGMATVYLAHDVRHDRQVAIKVLRPELAAVIGAERFLAEIRTTANLQHPHILALFDSGTVDGTVFYVMPFVDGESLRDRLSREKQLPIDDALRIAAEVADALEYAHGHGVIHRDIKPENILLHGGHALVADFGIALAASHTGGSRMTETGMSLGTPQYMSPEQAMGERELDARTDVYALGCVAYEMLTGEPPFSGPTAQSVVAKVMTERPAGIVKRRGRVPAHVEDAVLTALEKLPADRFASAREFAAALASPSTGARRAALAAGRGDGWFGRRAAAVVATLAVVAVAAGIWAFTRPASGSAEVNRFAIELGRGEGLSPTGAVRIAWSADGRSFAYIGGGTAAGTQVWLRSMNTLTASPVSGTDGATTPFLSPDGQQIGFVITTPFTLLTVPRSGGRPTVVVSDAISGGGASWSDDGWIYFDGASHLARIRPNGTGREVVSVLDTTQQEIGVAWPDALPHGRGVLFRVRRLGDDVRAYAIYVVDLKTRRRKLLVKAVVARYLSPGYLLYVLADGSLMASRFDLKHLDLVGEPVLIAKGLTVAGFGASDLAVAPNGSLLYSTGLGIATTQPVWVGRDGGTSPVDSAWQVSASAVALSPDGSRLALPLDGAFSGSTTRTVDIWIKQLPTGPISRLTLEGEQNRRPSWSPDGRDVLFLSSSGGRGGPPALYRQRADGTAPAQRVAADERGIAEGFESADGRWIIVRSEVGSPGDGDILAMRIGVDSAPKPLLASRFQELSPALSPDGHWLAYTSNETGRAEVYVRPFPDVQAGKFPVSSSGGVTPRWSHSGHELFYRTLSDDFMAAEVRTAPAFAVVGEKRLFSAAQYAPSGQHQVYDVSPDDRRFLMLRPSAGAGAPASDAPQLVLVQNLPAELKRLLR